MRTLSTVSTALLVTTLSTACRTSEPIGATVSPDARGTVIGHVLRAPDRVPVPNRAVLAHTTDGQQVGETLTDGLGGYSLRLPPGQYELSLKFELGDVFVERPPPVTLEPSEVEDGQDFVLRHTVAGLRP